MFLKIKLQITGALYMITSGMVAVENFPKDFGGLFAEAPIEE